MATDDRDEDGPGATMSPLGERIRRRRDELGLSAKDLAERVGISASYLSLIERQGRVPSEDVAVALATELADDVELYRAWARSKGYEDLGDHLWQLDRLHRVSSDPRARSLIASGRSVDDVLEEEGFPNHGAKISEDAGIGSPRRRMERFREVLSPVREEMPLPSAPIGTPAARSDRAAGIVRVPLLPNGADPARSPEPIEVLDLDARLLPPGARDCFAYRPDRRSVRRVHDLVHPGDLVVLSPAEGRVDPGRIYAIRHRGQVVLTRAIFKGDRLAMLPSSRDPWSFEWIRLEDDGSAMSERLRRVIAGVVVATLRWWGGG